MDIKLTAKELDLMTNSKGHHCLSEEKAQSRWKRLYELNLQQSFSF